MHLPYRLVNHVRLHWLAVWIASVLLLVSVGTTVAMRFDALMAMVTGIVVTNEDALLNPALTQPQVTVALSQTSIFVGNEDADDNPALTQPQINVDLSLTDFFVGNQDTTINPALAIPTLNPQPLTQIFVGNDDARVLADMEIPAIFIQLDSDGDGVLDSADACPTALLLQRTLMGSKI